MRKISEVLRQRYELNCSYRDIAQSLNLSTGTVSKYLAQAKLAGISWPLPEGMTEDILFARLFLPVERHIKKPPPDWSSVHIELRRKGVTLLLLWREYRVKHPDGLSYSSFCHGYHAHSKSVSPVMKQVHKAGEKSFVDYAGMTVPWIDCSTGIVHEAQIFVGVLGASQYIFVEATATQQLHDWIQSHVNMFQFFEGVTSIVVPDNLRSGVKKAHIYDPDINQNYQNFSEHYGVAIVPARVRAPKDKAKVENAVGHVERQILAAFRDRTFTSLYEINTAIRERTTPINNNRMQKMDVSRRELYETLDKPALKALPTEPYQYADWNKAKINIDYHFIFDNHFYSVLYKYIHQSVEIRASSKTIECFHQGQRIATHVRSFKKYAYTTLTEHMPEAHKAHAEWTPERMRRWAEKIGPQTAIFIELMIAARAFPQQAFRACLGVLRLGKKYGAERLEKACIKGIAVGATRYQQIESILSNKMEDTPLSAETVSIPLPLHDNIRGSEYYQ